MLSRMPTELPYPILSQSKESGKKRPEPPGWAKWAEVNEGEFELLFSSRKGV